MEYLFQCKRCLHQFFWSLGYHMAAFMVIVPFLVLLTSAFDFIITSSLSVSSLASSLLPLVENKSNFLYDICVVALLLHLVLWSLFYTIL